MPQALHSHICWIHNFQPGQGRLGIPQLCSVLHAASSSGFGHAAAFVVPARRREVLAVGP